MLTDVRLVDLSHGIAGAYLSRLFCDAGADVIRVEPEGGVALRRRSTSPPPEGTDGPLFVFLAAGSRSVVGELHDPEVEGLLADADVVVVDDALHPDEVFGLTARHPTAVVTSVRAYGLTGPWADRTPNEFLVQADAGSILCRGHQNLAPFAAGGEVFSWTTASYAAPPTLAAIDRARRSGRGDLVDVSMAEATAIAASTFSDLSVQMSGRADLPSRSMETPSIEPASDGWVGFNTNTRQQFQAFCLLIERPDLVDSEWADLRTRAARLDEWNEIVWTWTTRHPVDEILNRAAELRVPVARVNDGPGVLSEEHLKVRGFFHEGPGGFALPAPPRVIDGERPAPPGPVPRPGEHTGAIAARPERPAAVLPGANDPDTRPLAGVRVIDLTSWWAGPSSTQAMAALGADVIHVESVTHPDGMRLTGMMFGGENWWEWGHMFVAANNDKRGLTLDLTDPESRELLLRLVETADLVVENFSPRVLESFDLGWDVLSARNPSLVMVRMPAFGLDGPWRERVGFAQTMEQMSGMAWITGHADDQPRIMRGPCDPIAGMHGAFAALLGLRRRWASGAGVFVESPMVEAAINCSAEMIVEWSANGTRLEREGNRSRFAAPQGIYETQPEKWLALSVETDPQWEALAGLVGLDAASYPAEVDRRNAHDAIDAAITEWAADQTLEGAVGRLESVGVPAVPCRNHGVLHEHPQFEARGFYEKVAHPAVGTHLMPAQPYRMRAIERWIRTPTPTLGQHNHEILAEMGLSPGEIEALEADGRIGTTPRF